MAPLSLFPTAFGRGSNLFTPAWLRKAAGNPDVCTKVFPQVSLSVPALSGCVAGLIVIVIISIVIAAVMIGCLLLLVFVVGFVVIIVVVIGFCCYWLLLVLLL